MDKKYTGGCLCGNIRYGMNSEPVFSGNCHCRTCQILSGSGYNPAMIFLENAVKITGQPKYHQLIADSGKKVWRGFCPECGTQTFGKFESMPGMVGIGAGTLDDPAVYTPMLNFFVSSAQPWDVMDENIPKMPKGARG